ncbi:hypothetical protein A3F59_02610 [Candidatus Roizmanbacteria bacterium RIFCSPHIGHO2_12_FULL_38_13]|nr:MAG: hypothetical protein A3F59_02610 [Candidatus Roizmanbacteria bacterium RIFCSPHIGHO2_12_FULL_38_13]
MKFILTIFLSLIAFTALASYPIECRQNKTECQSRWDKGQDCYSLDNLYWTNQYGTDPDVCTAKAMFEYEKEERIKIARTEAEKNSIKGITMASEFAQDIRFDWATDTPLGGATDPERGSVSTGVLVGIISLIIVILSWLGYKKIK